MLRSKSVPNAHLGAAIAISAFAAVGLVVLVGACSSDDTEPATSPDGGTQFPDYEASTGDEGDVPAPACANPGGPVSGAPDNHCGLADGGTRIQPTLVASCSADAGPDPGDAGHAPDAQADAGRDAGHDAGHDAGADASRDAAASEGGSDGADAGDTREFGVTMNGNEGDDDDCKYHVKWASTPLCQAADMSFTVTVTNKSDGTAVHGAPVGLEYFRDAAHVISPANTTAFEHPEGTYTIGPVRFDSPGDWTVRFRIYDACASVPATSPRAHAAFYVHVN